jgi:HK97 family phage prohead protease
MYSERKISAMMRERKHMAFGLQLKSLDEAGRFAGYASIFDVVDNQRDIMLRGAFSQTLRTRKTDIKLLWQHQQSEPIGIIEQAFEDEYGLYIQGRLLLDVQKASEAMALLKAGAVKGLSIGYSPIRYRVEPDTGIRLLAEVDLWEVSLVTFPANEAAQVTVVKHDGESYDWKTAQKSGALIELSQALDNAIHTLTA